MKTHIFALAALASTVASQALTGCATDPRLGPEGRAGYVSEIYTAEKLRVSPPRCLTSLAAAQIAVGTYVEIKIPHGRHSEYLSAHVPVSIKPELLDKVEISPQYCKDGNVPEVIQILSGSIPPDAAPQAHPHRDRK